MTITVVGLAIAAAVFAAFSRPSQVRALDNGVGKVPCELSIAFNCWANFLTSAF